MHLYLDNTFLCSEYEELVQQTKCVLEVLVHAEGFGNQLTEDMQKFPYDRVKWNLIVSNESDMERIEKWRSCRNGSSNKTFLYSGK